MSENEHINISINALQVIFTLRASCGTVHCNQSCLCICGCVCLMFVYLLWVLRWGENFWLRLTTASEQCLRLSECFFHGDEILKAITDNQTKQTRHKQNKTQKTKKKQTDGSKITCKIFNLMLCGASEEFTCF